MYDVVPGHEADGVAPGQRGRAMGTIFTALELAIAVGSIAAGLAIAAIGFAMTFVAACAST